MKILIDTSDVQVMFSLVAPAFYLSVPAFIFL